MDWIGGIVVLVLFLVLFVNAKTLVVMWEDLLDAIRSRRTDETRER
jgi:hypothetical protein